MQRAQREKERKKMTGMDLPSDKQALLDAITARLAGVEGVQAVGLGGSYARGTQRPGSDLDIAIYYTEIKPFLIKDIQIVADEISVQGPPQVTDFYGWGAWVNGGAWIQTAAGKVDFLYRNLEQVQRTIQEAQQGITRHDYDQQPAYGFYSVIYLAETKVCVPLHDPAGHLAGLKAQVAVYPARLKERLTASSLWLAEFSLVHAAGYAANGDVYATAGALGRASAYMTQALFSLNETYFMNDKTALKELAEFALLPSGYVKRLAGILGRVGQSAAELGKSTLALRGLWQEVVELTGGTYKPAFKL